MYEPPSGDESTGLSNDDEGGDAGEGEEQGTEQGEDEREEDEQEELAALRIESEACSDMVSPSPRHQKVRWICMEGTEEKQVASSVDIRDNGDDEDPSNPENNRCGGSFGVGGSRGGNL